MAINITLILKEAANHASKEPIAPIMILLAEDANQAMYAY